jgi:hypothetical protein
MDLNFLEAEQKDWNKREPKFDLGFSTPTRTHTLKTSIAEPEPYQNFADPQHSLKRLNGLQINVFSQSI